MMTVLPQLSAIRFSGNDAGVFLHNQVSADVLSLSDGETTFACYCEPKGRVLALVLIGKTVEGYFVILSSALAEPITRRLRIYVMRSDVTITTLNDYAVAGCPGTEPSGAAIAKLPLPNDERLLGIIDKNEDLVINHDMAQEWKSDDLVQGICWLDEASSAQFLPQMLGLGEIGAINFRKGCYPGQEIVARTHYLGKLKRFPRVLKTAQPVGAKPMEKVTLLSGEDRFEAVVADTVESESNGCYLFTVVRMDPELEVDNIEFDGQSTQTEPLR